VNHHPKIKVIHTYIFFNQKVSKIGFKETSPKAVSQKTKEDSAGKSNNEKIKQSTQPTASQPSGTTYSG